MHRSRLVVTLVLVVALTVFPTRASEAGGWASVDIVDGPDSLTAGEPITFELLVQQHGVTPIDIDPLIVTATHATTFETVDAAATHGDRTGHYAVTMTFPIDGIWNLKATPGDFPPFDVGPVKVGGGSDTAALMAPAGVVTIDITGGMGSGAFEPAELKVTRGTLVVWTNDSMEGHTVAIDGRIEQSGLIAPGAAYALLFDEPGEFHYSCGPHPAMTGTIVVS